jgi:hypothetical protein
MSDACTINVSESIIDNSSRINYRNDMIINDTSRVIRMAPQLGALLPNETESVISDCNLFIIPGISY